MAELARQLIQVSALPRMHSSDALPRLGSRLIHSLPPSLAPLVLNDPGVRAARAQPKQTAPAAACHAQEAGPQARNKGFVLDGWPRSLAQAQALLCKLVPLSPAEAAEAEAAKAAAAAAAAAAGGRPSRPAAALLCAR
jgi:hypothetical protein